jgi:Uma2 family endonuclease
MATAEALLTAEDYLLLPDDGQATELVRGRVVSMNMPAPRHGQVCGKVVHLLLSFLERQDLGQVACNDAGVVTERDPDTVRGGDVVFYSYARVPQKPLPAGYLPVAPDLVFEVRSPTDRWKDVLAKVVEYLNAGVTLVCVLDPAAETAHVYHADQPERLFSVEQDLVLPEVLGEFRVPVRRLFE